MKQRSVNLFVKLWKAENLATRKILILDSKLEDAEAAGEPTKRLKSNLRSWRNKQKQAIKEIEVNVVNNNFPPNAAALCKDKLGFIQDYVADCYSSLHRDLKVKS